MYTNTSANMAENFNPINPILQSLRTVCLPRHVYELRCLAFTLNGKWPATVSGYYDDLEQLARDAATYDGHCKGIYVTLNPVKEALKARSYNHVREGVKDDDTTKDKHIVRRVWLPLDFDPERESGISSTNAEHDAALGRTAECRAWLREQGFPEPILADSGNGGHLLYQIDLANDDASGRLVTDFLKAVAAHFSDDRVKVDTAIYNPARIWKLYGSLARKGDNIAERPHRRSRILELPPALACVPGELLERLTGPAPASASTPAITAPDAAAPVLEKYRPVLGSSPGDAFDVPAWLDKHGLVVSKTAPYEGGYKWILQCCPFNPTHTGGCAVVIQRPNGRIGFKCQHNSC
jgi:hypothetical protein